MDLKADGSEDWRKVIFSQPAHQGQLARKFPESHNLAYAIGAVREAFEETGTLIIEPRRSAAGLSKEEADKVRANLADWRKKVSKTPSEFLNFCQQAGVAPAVRKIQPWSRICTPPSVPKRFDTRFFVTA